MAKKSRANASRGRGISPTANHRLPRVIATSPLVSVTPALQQLRAIEDRRHWHPAGDYRPARTLQGTRPSLTVQDRPRPSRSLPDRFGAKIRSQTNGVLAFQAPERVVVCIRRQRRKEVLHAKRKTGRVGQKKPRRNWLSAISCRR